MSRYERSQHFEALVRLRIAYAAGTDFDRRSILSIEDAITYGEAVMAALSAEDAFVHLEAEAADANATGEELHTSLDPRD
jgi:hypothetical protein